MATTTPTAPAPTTPAAPNGAKPEKAIRYVAVTMFPELLKALKNATAATPEHAEISLGTYVRDLLCAHFKLEKPTTTRRGRTSYANEAEKKAAKAAVKATRAELLKKLMAEHQAEIEKAIAEAEAAALAKVRGTAPAPETKS